MKVGCYTLDLYCRNSGDVFSEDPTKLDAIHTFKEFPHQYIGETRQECERQARKHGWIFNKDRDVTCPKCNKVSTP